MSTWTRVGALIAAVVLSVSGQAVAQEDKAKSDEQALMQLEEEWGKALAGGDVATIDRIVASDWTMIGPDGSVETKAGNIALLKSGEYKIETWSTGLMNVKMFGDVAVVTGSNTEKSTYKGQDTSGEYRWTDVFAKRDGRWQAVATHVSKVGGMAPISP
jgi:ketosteroid isomerase-like protein